MPYTTGNSAAKGAHTILRVNTLILTFFLILSLALPVCAQSSTTTYTDKDSGNTLSVPSDWKLEYKDDALVKVKFVPTSGTSALMQYGSIDLWSTLSKSAQNDLPRSEFHNDQLSKSDIADLVGTKSGNVEMVTIGGREYFQADSEKTTISGGYKFTLPVTYWVCVENGWFYIYQFAGGENHELYSKFKDMIASSTYSDIPNDDLSSGSRSETYASAVKAYNSRKYYNAQNLFSSVDGYKDSSKYLRLIRIRTANSNLGMGGKVYNSAYGLTSSQKSDIDAAARDFDFADTSEVLLCSPDVACYYLLGKWSGGSKCYIEFYENKNAGYSYYIGSKLSTNYSDTYSIYDGELRVDILGANKLTLSMTLTAPNCMEVYTHEKGNCYTLTRK